MKCHKEIKNLEPSYFEIVKDILIGSAILALLGFVAFKIFQTLFRVIFK